MSDRAIRVLFVSGSIGLGHAARDLAIARELRRRLPTVEIEWLAADPARRLLDHAGEVLVPESAELPDETGTAESTARGFSMNIISYSWHVRSAWRRTVATFETVLARHS